MESGAKLSVGSIMSVLLLAGCAQKDGARGNGGGSSATLDDGGIGDDGVGSATSGATGAVSTTAPVPTTGPTTSDDADPDTAGNEGPPLFDLGPIPDFGREAMGCAGIDFLFVVDDSGSMLAQQGQLLASFPGFIDGIENTLENVDSYHVGVITSDAYTGNAPGCQTLGDLVTQTWANGACGPFVDGGRFATDADDLASVFPCIANVGGGGSGIEQPVSGAVAAVSPAKAAPGACNEGFLREDAILVLIVLTDDPPYDPDFDDAHPGTDTSGWYSAIIDAKGGNPEAVVVVGFIPWSDISCVPLGLASPNLIGFVDEFGDQGTKASICAQDFGPVFTQAIETIQTTCNNFVPQG